MAPGNLPNLVARAQVVYDIYAPKEDLKILKQATIFSKLEKLGCVKLNKISTKDIKDPIQTHHNIWRKCVTKAIRANGIALFMPPDIIWSDGSLQYSLDQLEQGKKAIFMGLMRVASETCIPELLKNHCRPSSPIINLTGRELIAMGLNNAHPLWFTYFRESEHFPIHPELIVWPVASKGFLVRFLAREMFMFRAADLEINSSNQLLKLDNPADIHVITDTDQAAALSLAQLFQDIPWYQNPQTADPITIGQWWLNHDSPLNDFLASQSMRFHGDLVFENEWRKTEIQSAAFVRRIIIARETQRIIEGLRFYGETLAAQILSLALFEAGLMGRWPVTGPITAFIPSEKILKKWLNSKDSQLLGQKRKKDLIRAILRHVVPDDLELEQGMAKQIRMADGTERSISWTRNKAFLDGKPFHPEPLIVGSHRLHILDAVL